MRKTKTIRRKRRKSRKSRKSRKIKYGGGCSKTLEEIKLKLEAIENYPKGVYIRKELKSYFNTIQCLKNEIRINTNITPEEKSNKIEELEKILLLLKRKISIKKTLKNSASQASSASPASPVSPASLGLPKLARNKAFSLF
jgi:hypothetical protein